MKSIIFFTLFNMIAYISSKSLSKKVKTTLPSSTYCRTTLIDDDSSPDNVSYNGSFAVPNLKYDLEDDIKEVYIENRLASSNGLYKCNYTIYVCKNNNYQRCATFTGEMNPGAKRGLKAFHPAYASYFGDADSVKASIYMVDRNPPKPKPAPVVVKPVVVKPVVPVVVKPAPVVVKPTRKPEQTPISESAGTTQDDVMERHLGTRRKMRKSRKARKN